MDHSTIHFHGGRRVELGCPFPQTAPDDARQGALEAVLLFFDAGHWSAERAQAWYNRTHSTEATTKVLCDTVRAALGIAEEA